MNHRAGYRSREEAEHSKRYLSDPEHATLDEKCFCGLIHVDTPKPAPARRKTASRSTDPDRNSHPTPAVRRLVLERDGYACVCHGYSVIGQRYSLAHRLRASQGGKPVPSNLITVLGWGGEACHGRIDLYRDPEDEAKGYRLRSGQNPLLVPVMVFSEHGSGITVWLNDAGEYLTEDPATGRAA